MKMEMFWFSCQGYPPNLELCGFHHSNPWRCGWRRAASSGRDAPILSEGCGPAHPRTGRPRGAILLTVSPPQLPTARAVSSNDHFSDVSQTSRHVRKVRQIRTLGIYSAETSVGPLRRLKVAGGATPGSSA